MLSSAHIRPNSALRRRRFRNRNVSGIVKVEALDRNRSLSSIFLGSINELTSINKSLRSAAHSSEVVVEIVAVEKLLNRLSSQKKLRVFVLLIFKVFPFFVYVLLVKVISFGRDEGRFDFAVKEILPREVS